MKNNTVMGENLCTIRHRRVSDSTVSTNEFSKPALPNMFFQSSNDTDITSELQEGNHFIQHNSNCDQNSD